MSLDLHDQRNAGGEETGFLVPIHPEQLPLPDWGDDDFVSSLPNDLDAKLTSPPPLYPLALPPSDAADMLPDTLLGGGLYPGLHVLGGTTGGGKTALALHIAFQNALAQRPVLFVTFEQSKRELWHRLLGQQTQIPVSSFRSGQHQGAPLGLTLRTHTAYRELLGRVAPHLHILEGGMPSGDTYLAAVIRKVDAVRQHTGHAPLVVLDYLQRIPALRPADRRHQIDETVQILQTELGLQRQTPVLLLSSLSRAKYGEMQALTLEERLSAFKESGGIEYTAYTAFLLYPLSASDQSRLAPLPRPRGDATRYVVLDLVKNREGPTDMQFAVSWTPWDGSYQVLARLNSQPSRSPSRASSRSSKSRS